jgi:hypothetical protein
MLAKKQAEAAIDFDSLSREEIGYLAGLLDADGSIIIFKHPESQVLGVTIEISNTSVQLMFWLKENIGGYLYKLKKRKISTSGIEYKKVPFRWVVSKPDHQKFLEHVFQYLHDEKKKYRAQLILGYLRGEITAEQALERR